MGGILHLAAHLAPVTRMSRVGWSVVAFALGATAMISAAAGAEVVDLQLVLAADASSSMSDQELKLEREGYASAFRDPDIVQAIVSSPSGRIAVTYFEWSGEQDQKVLVPWTVIDSADSASRLASVFSAVTVTRNLVGGGRTSISAALQFGENLIATSGFSGERNVIDISADGVNNAGADVRLIRDEILAAGIVINGLPILTGFGAGSSPAGTLDVGAADLVDFFRDSRDRWTGILFPAGDQHQLFLPVSPQKAYHRNRRPDASNRGIAVPAAAWICVRCAPSTARGELLWFDLHQGSLASPRRRPCRGRRRRRRASDPID